MKITATLLRQRLKALSVHFPGLLPGVTIVPEKFRGEDAIAWAWCEALDNGGARIRVGVDVPGHFLDCVILHELIHCQEIAQTGFADPNHGPAFQQSAARIFRETGIDVTTPKA